MLSVHAHARWPDEDFPEDLDVMKLADAAAVLAKDDGRSPRSERRRAIAKLGGYRFRSESLNRDDVPEAIRTLSRGVPAAIDPVVFINKTLTDYTRLHAGDGPPSASELEAVIYDKDPFTTLVDNDCDPKALVVAPKEFHNGAAAVVSLQINRSVCSAAAALDPQSWDECSKFFKKPPERAYLASLANETPIPEPTLPLGSEYGQSPERKLFEHYICPEVEEGLKTGCDADIQNLLSVSTEWGFVAGNSGPRRYRSLYSLVGGKTLKGSVSKVPTQLLADQGASEVTEISDGVSIVNGSKAVSFDNDIINGGNQAILTVMIDEMVGEYAELACCPVTPYSDGPCDQP